MNAAVDAANVQSPVKPRPRRWRWILILAGPLLFAAVALTVGVGIVMYFLIESIEMRVLHWRFSND